MLHFARPTSYSCGESLQIQEHLIKACPKACPTYERHKNIHYDISPNIYLSDILRTEISIVAPAGFLGKS